MVVAEPFRVKIVQPNPPVPRHARAEALRRAGENVYRLPREAVYLDVLTTEGAEAMSDRQWAALMVGDEAYAGSRNFYHLERVAAEVFGKRGIVPAHQGRGAENLLLRAIAGPREGRRVLVNGTPPTLRALARDLDFELVDVAVPQQRDPQDGATYKGDVDLDRLDRELSRVPPPAMIALAASVPLVGGQVLSPVCLEAVCERARRAGVPVALDATQVASAAEFWREHEGSERSLAQIVRRYAEPVDFVAMSARGDAFCHTGGLIATDDEEGLRRLRALVVVFEGLHTYGGQAGRDLEAFAVGLSEMLDEAYQRFRRRKLEHIERQVRAAGLPYYRPVGTSGIALDARALLPGGGDDLYRAEALAAALYLATGIRTGPYGRLRGLEELELLGVYVPRRTYTQRQIDFILEALASIPDLGVEPFRLAEGGDDARHELVAFEPARGWRAPVRRFPATSARPEPYIFKAVEPLVPGDAARRRQAIEAAGYNTFLLRSEDVYIDLLTDSGTSAMSSQQWARMLAAVESETGTDGFAALGAAAREILGFRYVLPTHQGRGAEHLLSRTLIRPGQYVVNNMYFTTTREHQERAGGKFVDLIVDEAHDPDSHHPFKGDIDTDRLEAFVREVGAEKIAYICLELDVNMAGGQPVSMAGARRVSAMARYYGIPLYFDATRMAENAWFIKTRESGFASWSVREILRELMGLADGCTISAKKDLLVNIGGLLLTDDERVYRRAAELACVYEGTPRQGGLASRDLAAMAEGLYEVSDEDYLRNRIEQVAYLASALRARGIPIVEPPGGHAVFVDARRFLDHLPQDQFPAQRLAAEIYVASGVRGMERGIVSAGRDPETGENIPSRLELVRLTIPRRVYTYTHMDVVAEGVARVYDRRRSIGGLRMTYEPEVLRFFQARFEPIESV